MPCYHPNIIYMDTSKSPGKMLDFLPGNKKDEPLNYEYYEELNRYYSKKGIMKEYLKVPCGKCIGCKEAKSKQWATRCSLESEQWEQNWFITLTYNEEYVPRDDELINKKTGEIFYNDNWEQGHLVKEEVITFLKDLREKWRHDYGHTNIRFFLCGEYGTATEGTHRPHYHIIAFNLPIPTWELTVRKIDGDGNTHWTCGPIERCWEDKRLAKKNIHVPKGFVDICEVNWDTCAYVARYTLKKEGENKTDEWYYENGRTPEFINMSRKPGIGMGFFTKNFQNIYKNDEIIIKGHRQKIQPVKPPSYYDKQFDLIDHISLLEIKNKRKRIAKALAKNANMQTSLPEWERLRKEEQLKKCKMNTLARNKV